ncbi:MAG: nicotinate-nucleotide adenylyltransferase [Gammaproteobacteria bacterium]|nr:nicotinate-nucleotide adenylyltransferase [Gammaproteobacteria bacterium]MBU1408504.1 nicotinate-nucleotide adenylyltransferase [Gammaproteobacteria bacterium]MBU1532316.1 nicotinate-nucleotide adenylyltransferase [Gammaproteobacteria bacterium]
MQAIGIFGGTFDPIHFGHLRLAEEMAEGLGLGRVLFIPAGQPPHRGAPRTAASHRLEMVRRAISGNPRFDADAREVERPRPSYTVDTLTALRAELGNDQPLWLLLGADAFLELPTWHEWRRLFDLANIAVAARPGAQQSDAMPDPLKSEVLQRQVADGSAAGPAGSVLWRATTPLDISATVIRDTLARHGSARYLLPDAVLDYIHEHQLYTHYEH